MAGIATTWSATPYYAGVDLNDPAARESANYAAHMGLVNFQNQFQGDPRNQAGPIPTFGNPYDSQLGQPFAQDVGPNHFGGAPDPLFQQQMAMNRRGDPGSVNATNVKPMGYQTAKPAAKKASAKPGGPPAQQRPAMTATQQNERNAKWANKGGQSQEQEARQFLQGQGVSTTAAPEQYAQDVNQLRQQNLRVGGSPNDPMMTMDPYGRGIGDFGRQELNPETQQQLNDFYQQRDQQRYEDARAAKQGAPNMLGYQPQRAPSMPGMNGVGGGNRQGLQGPGQQQVPTLANNPTAVANGLGGSGIFMRPQGQGGQQPAQPQYPHQNVNPGNFAPQPTGNDLYGNALPGRPGKTSPQAPTGYVPRPDPRMGIPVRPTGMAPTGGGGGQGMAPPSNPGGSFGGAYGNPANQGGYGGGGPALTFGGNQNNYGGYGQPQGGGGMMNNLPGILGGMGIQPSGRTTTTTTQRMPTQRYVTMNQQQFTY